MDIFFWVMIGLFAAFMAKTQLPAQREEGMLGLLAAGLIGAVATGWLVHTLGRSGGFLGMVWVSHVAALLGAVVLLVVQRAATSQRV
jgi:uncharacterized membrane protein YeaQ/YmgE (transglycosylase-associated protein family)